MNDLKPGDKFNAYAKSDHPGKPHCANPMVCTRAFDTVTHATSGECELELYKADWEFERIE